MKSEARVTSTDEIDSSETYKYDNASYVNKLNVDILSLLGDASFIPFGKISKNLPTSVNNEKYSYEFDSDGYVTKNCAEKF